MQQTAPTFDANRLTHPTQRRLNAAWMEVVRREPVQVVPQVFRELTSHRVDPNFLPEERARLVRDLHRARNSATPKELMGLRADLWWTDEAIRADGICEVIDLSSDDRRRAEDIRAAFPPNAFPITPASDIPNHGDAIIISEALAAGRPLLVTSNMNTIEHVEINEWAAKHADEFGIIEPDILHVQDEVMPRMFRGPRRPLLCVLGLCAAWPDKKDIGLDEADRALLRMQAAMEGAQLRDTWIAIENTWRRHERPDELLEMARSRLPARMRAAEWRHPARVDAQRRRMRAGRPESGPPT